MSEYDAEDYADAVLTRRDIEAIAPRVIAEATAPQFSALYEMMGETNLEAAKRKNADIFNKFGSEINALVAGTPPERRTLDNLDVIVGFVRAQHVDELLEERVARFVSERAAAISAPPSRDATFTLNSDTLSPEFRKRAKETGLTDSVIAEYCRANDITVEDWYKSAEKANALG